MRVQKLRKAEREFRGEVRRLVGAVGKVVRSLNWHEGQSGVRQRHFHEKWKRAEVDNVIGEQKRLNRGLLVTVLLAYMIRNWYV